MKLKQKNAIINIIILQNSDKRLFLRHKKLSFINVELMVNYSKNLPLIQHL